MSGILHEARIPKTQYGALEIRCRSLGLQTVPVLGFGVTRFVSITPDQSMRDASNQRIFDLTYGKFSSFVMTIPIATMDIYIKIRRAYTGGNIGETALISLAMDSLDNLRDDQLVSLYDFWTGNQIVLGALI